MYLTIMMTAVGIQLEKYVYNKFTRSFFGKYLLVNNKREFVTGVTGVLNYS